MKTLLKLFVLSLTLTTAFAMDDDKSYTLLLLNITDEAKYNEYRNNINGIFAEIGGHVERELTLNGPSESSFGEFGPYNRALVLYYDTPDGPNRLMHHPDYAQHRPLMEASLDGFVFATGKTAPTATSNADNRFYAISLSWLKEDSTNREQDSIALKKELAQRGVHIERTFETLKTAGTETSPNLVTVYYFDTPETAQKMAADTELNEKMKAFHEKHIAQYAVVTGTTMKDSNSVALYNKKTDAIAAPLTEAPLRVVRAASFNLPPEKVFTLVGNHKSLPQIAPMIHEVSLDNSNAKVENGLGCVRICKLADGNELRETMVQWNPPVSYAYAFTGSNPMGTTDHLGVFHCERADDGTTILTWSHYFNHPAADQVAGQLGSIMEMILGNLITQNGGKLVAR